MPPTRLGCIFIKLYKKKNVTEIWSVALVTHGMQYNEKKKQEQTGTGIIKKL